MSRLFLFVVPLALDTFAVAAALGLARLPARERLRVSLLMSGFETAMPLVGLAAGRGVGTALGGAADYVAVATLAAVGVWMLVSRDPAVEVPRMRGLALIAVGLSVSMDELAMGFSIGLLHLTLWLAVLLIGAQAFVAAQLGLRPGSRVSASMREAAEKLAGLALLALAVFFIVTT